MEHLLNTYQTAKLLDYHPQTVRDLARKGVIPGIKRRQKWFFDPQRVQDWFHSLDNGTGNGNDKAQKIGDL